MTAGPWIVSPATLIRAEDLGDLDEPFACLLGAGPEGEPAAVVARAARALLDLPAVPPVPPPWLAPHQGPAAVRLTAILGRYRGAVLADAAGLGKSYIAIAVAMMRREPFTLVVPAVLVPQWRSLCRRFGLEPLILTHEHLSRRAASSPLKHGSGSASARDTGARQEVPLSAADAEPRVHSRRPLLVVDEAHHFRNPATRRYRALARMAIGNPILLITATPIHNGIGDLMHLLRLFLRDDALAGFGVASLRTSAKGEGAASLPFALARLVVARSRARAPSLALPRRARGSVIRAGPASEERIDELVDGIQSLTPGPAGALIKLVLLSRLASSPAAFRESLSRQRAFADFALEARRTGRSLTRRDFQRLFPRGEEPDLQLALLPMLLPEGGADPASASVDGLERLEALTAGGPDPKAECLDRLLAKRPGKTIVFTASRATARYLLRQLQPRHRVAAITGTRGHLPAGPATVPEVLRAFAPRAAGVAPPPPSLAIDVLVATDLASEGLNLQDAVRVVNYDLPWTAARLAQRVGRIDRLGSGHGKIETVSLLPPRRLAGALGLETRLLQKARAGRRVGAPAVETTGGRAAGPAAFDWCDRLQALSQPAGPGAACAVAGPDDAVVLVIAVGSSCHVLAVRPTGVTTDPTAVVRILEPASGAGALPLDAGRLRDALKRAAPFIRKRLALLRAARWRPGDRDQLSRRLIPMVVMDARGAARAGDSVRVARLDALVARLGTGMTAGEEGSLASIVESPAPLTPDRLLAWHASLPAVETDDHVPAVQLVAVVVVRAPGPG